MKAGIGYDIHRLADGRPLVLAGVAVESAKGPEAHSDGDVLAHAIIDALLGAAGLGDIGGHFPDTDDAWKDAAGLDLLARCRVIVAESGHRIENVDATVFLETPRLKDRKARMAANIAVALEISPERVNVKAGTFEGLGPVGRGEAIAAQAVAAVRADQA